jgi:hypothetical protein
MEREDAFKMAALIAVIVIIIVLGFYLTNPTGYAIAKCVDLTETYITFEPYKTYGFETKWGELYLKVLDNSINIPSDKPTYVSYSMCSPCKYNISFYSDKPTNFFIFDKPNKDRFFSRESSFPIASDTNSVKANFSLEFETSAKYYFIFDRSFQGTSTSDPATGRLIIYELSGINQTIEKTEYREVKNYRNVTRCE